MKIIQEKEHPDVVVGLFHSGREGGIKTKDYEEDASCVVAQQVPGFDIIMFGHDHTRFNQKIKNIEGKEVLCIDPANNAMTVAQADLTLTLKNGKVADKQVTGTLVDVTKLPIDEEYMAHFKPEIERIQRLHSQS